MPFYIRRLPSGSPYIMVDSVNPHYFISPLAIQSKTYNHGLIHTTAEWDHAWKRGKPIATCTSLEQCKLILEYI